MLGIVFTGGEGPDPLIIKNNLTGIGSLFIVAADSGLALAERAGYTPDIIIGDMDSVDAELLARYPAESVIRHPIAKDYTDTELAMQKVIEKGCKRIWIIGGGGGRLDHLFGIRSLFERDITPCRWIMDKEDVYCIEKGNHYFSVDVGENVSVFPLGDGEWEATSESLKWPLDGIKWNRGFFGLCNVAIEDCFNITVHAGRFMVIIPANYAVKKQEKC